MMIQANARFDDFVSDFLKSCNWCRFLTVRFHELR